MGVSSNEFVWLERWLTCWWNESWKCQSLIRSDWCDVRRLNFDFCYLAHPLSINMLWIMDHCYFVLWKISHKCGVLCCVVLSLWLYKMWDNPEGQHGWALLLECHPWQWKNCQKSGKIQEKSGRKGKREVSFTLPLLTDRAGYATGLMQKYWNWPQEWDPNEGSWFKCNKDFL